MSVSDQTKVVLPAAKVLTMIGVIILGAWVASAWATSARSDIDGNRDEIVEVKHEIGERLNRMESRQKESLDKLDTEVNAMRVKRVFGRRVR